MPLHIAPHIVADPKVRFGKPIIEGTRIPVALVIAKLGAGLTMEEVASEYELDLSDIRAALSYAASVVASEEVRVTA